MFNLFSCKVSIDNCECSEIEIYKDSQGLLPQIVLTRKTHEVFEPIYFINQNEINEIIDKLKNEQLAQEENIDYFYRLDYLLKLKCDYGKILFVEIRQEYTKIDELFFYSDSILTKELDKIYLEYLE